MQTVQKLLLAVLALSLSLFGLTAHAAGPDLTALTTAVDFSSVTAAVLAVAASLIVVYIAWKGARLVLNAVKGG